MRKTLIYQLPENYFFICFDVDCCFQMFFRIFFTKLSFESSLIDLFALINLHYFTKSVITKTYEVYLEQTSSSLFPLDILTVAIFASKSSGITKKI